MKKLFVPGLLAAIILLAACKKDSSNSTTGIEGTYNFKYISAKSTSSLTGSAGDKIITISDYSTINNGGVITFSNNSLTAKDLTYSVNTQAKAYQYDGSDLIDSLSYPFSFTLPSSNSTGQYKIIGTDSIYFPQGGLTVPTDGSGPYQGSAGGGHFTLSGNLLTIIQNVSRDSSFRNSGETYQQTQRATTSIVLEKQ